jgi:hypothetical protein
MFAVGSEIKLTIAPIEQIALAQRFLAPVRESFNQAAAFAKLFTDFHTNLHRTFEQWIAEQQLSWVRVAEMMAIAAENFERYRDEEEPEACKLLSDAGWLGMDQHFGIQHLRVVVVVHKTQGEAAMNDAILDYFSHDNSALLVAMSERWLSIPYLRDRENIIRDAVDAHQQGKFTLSIPTLLPMVDGLSAEVLGMQSMKAVALLAEDRRANDPEVWTQGFCDFLAQVYYKGYEFGKDPAPFLNRHGILHGRVFDYPSALNSTRVFLLIDAVAEIWQEKQKALVPTTIQ